MAGRHFRAGVVLVVRGADGRVLAFERGDVRGSWQLPQGGIRRREDPVHAAWRELAEETGLTAEEVSLVEEHPHWTVYAWPADQVGADDRIGQAHRWFFFSAPDDVEPRPDGRELVAWKWVTVEWLVDHVVEFRRRSYEAVFGPELRGAPG